MRHAAIVSRVFYSVLCSLKCNPIRNRYVEFQNTMAAVIKVHKSALRARRHFWRLLASPDVSFRMLSTAMSSMGSHDSAAEKTYRLALEKYPRTPRLLQSFGYFIEEIRSDPLRARKYFLEAEKLEEAGDDAVEVDDLDEGQGLGSGQVDDKRDAVAVINSTGILQIVNPKLAKMFGCAHRNAVCLQLRVTIRRVFAPPTTCKAAECGCVCVFPSASA